MPPAVPGACELPSSLGRFTPALRRGFRTRPIMLVDCPFAFLDFDLALKPEEVER